MSNVASDILVFSSVVALTTVGLSLAAVGVGKFLAWRANRRFAAYLEGMSKEG